MQKPLVSICLLSYQHENYIEDCLKSILSQTYPEIEVLINNDGSTDNTAQIINNYMPILNKTFNRVIFYNNTINSGIPKSCNRLIKNANGKYIKLFAGDDIMHEKCIESLTACLEINKDAIMCYSNGFAVHNNYKFSQELQHTKKQYVYHAPPQQEKQFESLIKRNYIFAPSAMVRKTAYEKYGMHDENLYFEDYEFWIRLSRQEKFVYLPECLVYYRKSDTSVTNYTGRKGRMKLQNVMYSERKLIAKYSNNLDAETRKLYVRWCYERYFRFALSNGHYVMALQILYKLRQAGYNISLYINELKDSIRK